MIESPVLKNKTSVVDEQETMMENDENLEELSTIIALADGLDISQNAGGNSLAREKDPSSLVKELPKEQRKETSKISGTKRGRK